MEMGCFPECMARIPPSQPQGCRQGIALLADVMVPLLKAATLA